MIIYTIGFTKKSAEEFFTTLKNNNVEKVIDIRLNNSSQLAGFSKEIDLIYFLKELLDIDYQHIPLLSPSKEILDNYKKNIINWEQYEDLYLRLIEDRKLVFLKKPELFHNVCFLCSEDLPNNCHRRLIADYIKELNSDKKIKIIHL